MSNLNGNNSNKPTGALNNLNGVVEYSKIKGNVGPYVRSRVWANRVARAARSRNTNGQQVGINFTNRRPTMKMVKMALAQALGVRYTTTGRGGGLEDAPFIPGVSALPTIQRDVWSTPEAYLPVDTIRQRMEGHWGIDEISNNINRMPSNNGSFKREEKLLNGAISSFYHPAFTQVCKGNGEWLINGFKVNKGAAVQLAANLLKRPVETIEYDPRSGNKQEFLVGSGSKGTQQAEADILKISILNWPRSNSNNYSRTRIIFTVGEDKVGPGESAQAHGKEVAQLRFIMFAIYYMWLALHEPGEPYHQWSKIPVQNIKLEAVFLAAGADRVQNTKITEQAAKERTGILSKNAPYSAKTVIPVVPINLDKFCAIFRLDAYRFAMAMTAVDKKFRDKMIEYFQEISNLNSGRKPNTQVNNTTMINVSTGLATTKLNTATLGRKFKPVVLREPRTSWKNNQNRKNWEVYWLKKYKSVGNYRRSVNNALAAFGAPSNNTSANNNRASYYSGESAPNIFNIRQRQALLKKNKETKANREAAELQAMLMAAKAATAARRAATPAAKNKEKAERALTAAQKEIERIDFKAKFKTENARIAARRKAMETLERAQLNYNKAKAVFNREMGEPNLSNAALNAMINSSNQFYKIYSNFLAQHVNFKPAIKAAVNLRIAAKMNEDPEYFGEIRKTKLNINRRV